MAEHGESHTAGAAPGTFKFPWMAAGLTVCMAICCAVLFRMAQRAGRELNFFKVDAAETIPLSAPGWVPSEWIAEARVRIGRHGVFSVFDDAKVKQMRDDLESLPWVKEAREIERGLPRTLRLALVPREPVAIIETRAALVLVDSEGVVLPPAVFPADRVAILPRIIKSPGEFSVPEAGRPWTDEGVLNGVSMALLLPKLYFQDLSVIAPGFRIVNIDVSNVEGEVNRRETEILLTTGTGARIKWGRAPRSAKFGEVPTDVKFKNLANILMEYPNLNGVAVVNLRFDQPDVFDSTGAWIPRPALAGR